ncbi:hypothetical protein FC093_17275 [Ilyomonas limi]|uniref:Uncharacterized protein n=1 Tax=Ilyomonas limi TaxID=2575867 RepID=A0A4U3KXC5_9BACT|nr:hypothetical protein [Ilyomonas limi]TKK66334.1 hypothetical protein FC093_17275 [Ilyomonas limi]
MLTQFKKLKDAKQCGRSITTNLTMYVSKKLQQFAIYLTKKTNHIQPRRLAIFILTFCVIVSLALSIKLLYCFNHKPEIHFQYISTPVLKPATTYSGDATTLHRIKNFHRQLDSLKKNNFLRYDSIMRCRPHLLDSIIMVERLTNF